MNIMKTNQDNYISIIWSDYNLALLGVFDGHGREGHLVS